MKPLNENGIAYGFFMIVAFLICATLMWVFVGVVYNKILVDEVNPAIAAGEISMQTRSATNFNVAFERFLPVFLLIGIFLWASTRAIYRKGGG